MHLIRPKTGGSYALLALVALAVTACDDNPSEPTTPSAITAVTGTTITGRAGTTSNVTVSVTTSNGKTLPNTPVTFAVSSGGGTVVPPSTSTDANGQATATWTFGSTLGAQTLTVTAGAITQTITATVAAGLPASVAVSAGAGQSAPAGTAVTTAPAVLVKDAAGNPVPGVSVQFTSLPTGAVVPTQVTTDASGIARVTSWTLGQQAGTYTLQATVLGQNVSGNPLTITATATAGAATRIQASNTFPTTATVGSALTGAQLPSVTVTDANGNPVSGVTVTFAVTSGGGQLTGAVATTNAQGVASATGFTLGQTAGPNTLTATAQGIGTANLAVTGTAAAAATTQIVSGNNLSAPAGQALASGPSVKVVDRFGNPVSGATVTFLITAGNGSLLGNTQTTNAQGIATVGGWTLGPLPGTNTLVARVAGAPDVTFTAAGLAGPPAQLLKVSGDSLKVIAFGTASAPFVVRVLDAAGFPVRNAPVTFALVTPGSGTLSPTTAQTDSLGRATSTFTANGALGTYDVTATAAGLTPVTFTVTTTRNVPVSATAVGPTSQQATAGAVAGSNPAVLIRDAAGNPVPGVTVFFDTYGGAAVSGTVQNRVAVSDASGVATAGQWTLSGTAGVNTLAATINAANIPAIIFTATGITIPAGSSVTIVAGTVPVTAAPSSSVSPAVLVRTPSGAPLVGVTVQFTVTLGGGLINGNATYTTVTDASGVARVPSWVLGTGNNTVNQLAASVVNGPSVDIVVTTQ